MFWLLAFALSSQPLYAQLPSGWKAHDLERPLPKVVTPGERQTDPPSDAEVLFDGESLKGWTDGNGQPSKWEVVDGVLQSVRGAGPIYTEAKFGDCQLHVEFATPTNVKGDGQGRGNSGVFLMGDYEIQVLDSFENPTYADGGAGAIYGQYPPLVNASRGPGEWQSYDIIFRRPRHDEAGKLVEPARLTVLHNGVLIQDHSEIYGPTSWIQHRAYGDEKKEGRLSFQDHGNPVRFRNVWVRRLQEARPRPSHVVVDDFELTAEQQAALVGKYGNLPVTERDGKLYIRFAGAPLEMVPRSATEFSLRKTAGRVTFEMDDQGRPVTCTLELDAAGKRSGQREYSEGP